METITHNLLDFERLSCASQVYIGGGHHAQLAPRGDFRSYLRPRAKKMTETGVEVEVEDPDRPYNPASTPTPFINFELHGYALLASFDRSATNETISPSSFVFPPN
ncbi:hypothetical protein PQX77_000471, partial [Marasmius sp. AFHP31]